MKQPCVEFYKSFKATRFGSNAEAPNFAWRLRAENGQTILSPHETFISHRNAVESFRRVADAMDAQGVWQVEDLEGVRGSVEMLCCP